MLLGLHLMLFRLLINTHQFTCSVSWWCAGTRTALPTAINAGSSQEKVNVVIGPVQLWEAHAEDRNAGKFK